MLHVVSVTSYLCHTWRLTAPARGLFILASPLRLIAVQENTLDCSVKLRGGFPTSVLPFGSREILNFWFRVFRVGNCMVTPQHEQRKRRKEREEKKKKKKFFFHFLRTLCSSFQRGFTFLSGFCLLLKWRFANHENRLKSQGHSYEVNDTRVSAGLLDYGIAGFWTLCRCPN